MYMYTYRHMYVCIIIYYIHVDRSFIVYNCRTEAVHKDLSAKSGSQQAQFKCLQRYFCKLREVPGNASGWYMHVHVGVYRTNTGTFLLSQLFSIVLIDPIPKINNAQVVHTVVDSLPFF